MPDTVSADDGAPADDTIAPDQTEALAAILDAESASREMLIALRSWADLRPRKDDDEDVQSAINLVVEAACKRAKRIMESDVALEA